MKTQSTWIAGLRSIETAETDWRQIQLYLGNEALQTATFITEEGLTVHLSDIDQTCTNIGYITRRFPDIAPVVTETEMALFYLQASEVSQHIAILRSACQNVFGEIPSLPIDTGVIADFISQPVIQAEFDLLSKETYVLWPTLLRFWQYAQLFDLVGEPPTSKGPGLGETLSQKFSDLAARAKDVLHSGWEEISDLLDALPLEDLLSTYGRNLLHSSRQIRRAKQQIYLSIGLLLLAIIGVSFVPTHTVPVLNYFATISGTFGVIMSIFWRLLVLVPFVAWGLFKFYEYRALLKIRAFHTPQDIFRDAIVSAAVRVLRLLKERPAHFKDDLLRISMSTLILFLRKKYQKRH